MRRLVHPLRFLLTLFLRYMNAAGAPSTIGSPTRLRKNFSQPPGGRSSISLAW